jgi:hypothetical protein
MLTLSGGFSSSKGDLIKATLTANIQDLDSYQAPQFELIGAEVANLVSYTLSDDKNTLTITPSEEASGLVNIVNVFTPSATESEWTNTTTQKFNGEGRFEASTVVFHSQSRRFSTTTNEKGLLYSFYYTFQADAEAAPTELYAESYKITPVDEDNNGSIDTYTYENTWAATWADDQYWYNGPKTENLDLSALINSDGYLVDNNGDVFDYSDNNQTFNSITDALGYLTRTNEIDLTNAVQGFVYTMISQNRTALAMSLTNKDIAQVLFTDEHLAKGDVSALPTNANISSKYIADALSITVSEDKNTVEINLEGGFSQTRTFSGDGAGNYSALATANHENGTMTEDSQTSVATDIGLDYPELIITRYGTWNDGEYSTYKWAEQSKLSPIDDNGDNIADHFKLAILYGHSISNTGELLSYDGSVMSFDDSYDTAEANTIEDLVEMSLFRLVINPYTASTAMDFYKNLVVNRDNYNFMYTVGGIGKLEVEFSDDDITSISAGSSNNFSAFNTYPDSDKSLENEDVFLDVNAALSLEVILGQYEVNLTLSGERTGLEDGEFDLAMSYKLPGETAQRSFVVHANTEEEETLIADNSEGVTLVLKELEKDSDSNIIGTIFVDSVQAAQIEDRDGLIVVVYSNGDTTSL